MTHPSFRMQKSTHVENHTVRFEVGVVVSSKEFVAKEAVESWFDSQEIMDLMQARLKENVLQEMKRILQVEGVIE